MRYVDLQLQRPPTVRRRTIASFNDGDIAPLFRFRPKDQLKRLLAVLRLPAVIRCKSFVITSEEMMLVSLRLGSPGILAHLAADFGGDYSRWSKVTSYFMKHLCENDSMSSVRESIEWINADIKNR